MISTPMVLHLHPVTLDGAVKSLADILPDMIRLAECEKACQLMAAEIEKTRRRVNALEHVIIPEAEKNIKYITMKLDENERSTQIRLMKVKDMTLEEAHHYNKKKNAWLKLRDMNSRCEADTMRKRYQFCDGCFMLKRNLSRQVRKGGNDRVPFVLYSFGDISRGRNEEKSINILYIINCILSGNVLI